MPVSYLKHVNHFIYGGTVPYDKLNETLTTPRTLEKVDNLEVDKQNTIIKTLPQHCSSV